MTTQGRGYPLPHLGHFGLVSGKRIRLPSLWQIRGAELPDNEEFAHALFDFLVAKAGKGFFTQARIDSLAAAYKTRAVS
jgi:hypothetical protein